MIDWEFKAREFGNCNCAWGCPCQFNALPTQGYCEAVVGFMIDEGFFGVTHLDGLRAVAMLRWPGAIHEGGGEALTIICEEATKAQRNALLTIMAGEETEPGATMFSVFASTLDKAHSPFFKPIDIEIDIEARRGHIFIDGLVEAQGNPILNPITGEEHRVRIDMLQGFEYRIAEMGNASSKTAGPIALELNDSYAQFNVLHLCPSGIVV